MVETGNAWVYRKYNNNPELILLEDNAKVAKIGLWSLPESEQTPPWQWRQMKKQKQPIEPE